MARRRFAFLASHATLFAGLFAAQSLLAGLILAAQTSPAPAPVPAHVHKPAPAHAHKPVHSDKQQKQSTGVQSAAKPATTPAPAAPKAPDWPANDLPAAASVVWNSHGLSIVAFNSSLAQILKEVAMETGAKVEGMDTDQRIFGAYGPGPARDVLSQLLDGSGYNVLMIGDRGQGTPRRIVLSIQSASSAQRAATARPSAPSEEETEADQQEQEPPEQPEPSQNGAAPPVPVRSPQQMMQEMQERQRQHQMEQTQNGQPNPQN